MALLIEGPSESDELFAPAMHDDSVTIGRQDKNSIGEYGRQISADSDEEE